MINRSRILFADSHPGILEGFRNLLEPLVEVIYMVVNEQSLRDAVTRVTPELIIVDLSMPVASEANVARLLQKLNPDIPFIVLSLHDEKTVLQECLAAGARGFVLKRTAAVDLVPAVEAVLGGQTYVSPSIAPPTA
jgi:DNA-binding NarL/FixJ family response regulator